MGCHHTGKKNYSNNHLIALPELASGADAVAAVDASVEVTF